VRPWRSVTIELLEEAAMYDSPDELLAKIRLGEDSTLECKTVTFRGQRIDGPRRDDLADELAAFANIADGVLVLGVDDRTKDIIGIPLDRLDSVETYVREICNDSIDPPLIVKIIRMNLPDLLGQDRAVIKIDIQRSLFVHKSPHGYFYRLGSSKREMKPDLLARLFQQRSQARMIHFDEQEVPNTTFDDLDEKLWQRFVASDDKNPQLTLRKMGILLEDSTVPGIKRASVTGVLMCSPIPSRWVAGAFIQAVSYRGRTRDANYQLDAADLTGPLDEQVRQALAFIKKNMKIMAIKEPARREIPQFSIRACFEAIVNAVAHRDYSIHGSKIRLHIFNDRLELYSPGPPPNTITLENLALRQVTRNELLTGLLARCPVTEDKEQIYRQFMMDRRGEGVPIILEETERLTGTLPEYKLINNTELLLIIPAAVLKS